jgi:hypothetical protein
MRNQKVKLVTVEKLPVCVATMLCGKSSVQASEFQKIGRNMRPVNSINEYFDGGEDVKP